MDIKGAIFDLDGTLIDSLIFWDYFWKELAVFCGDLDFKITAEDDKKARTTTLKMALDYVKSKYNLSKSEDEIFDFANNKMEDFYKNKVELKKGVIELLNYLKEKGVKICLATATDLKLVDLVLEKFDLKKYFDATCSCADIKKGKDQPDIYYKAIELIGTKIDDTWIFEDSLVAIMTAKKVGFKTVGIYDINNYGQEEIKSLVDLYVREGESLTKFYK